MQQRMLLDAEKASRAKFDSIFQSLAFTFVKDTGLVDEYTQTLRTEDFNFTCLRALYAHFHNECMDWSDYGLTYVKALVNLCAEQEASDIQEVVSNICSTW